MEQYLDLLKTIREKGTYKPAAREGMPGTQSLFGHQMRVDLSKGFPLLTTKKMFWKGVVVELLWFLKGDTNIKYLIDNGVNIWNEDAYNYYLKKRKHFTETTQQGRALDLVTNFTPLTFDEFINEVKNGENEDMDGFGVGYEYGDCGFQYGKVWRDWETPIVKGNGETTQVVVDQIRNLILSLSKTPESRRHLVTALDPANDKDLALYWCHAMFQFNCRPLSPLEIINEAKKRGLWVDGSEFKATNLLVNAEGQMFHEWVAEHQDKFPTYALDCQLYQRSADVVLGVPFNIASYALLVEILAEICNMVPGEFIHTFGDVHIYDNHNEAVDEQLTRTPTKLPTLKLSDNAKGSLRSLKTNAEFIPNTITGIFDELTVDDFEVVDYNPQSSIKAKLSTGLV